MIVTDPDIRDIEVRTHALRGVAEFRAPTGGAWRPLLVESGTVTLNDAGVLPNRTCEVNVMSLGADGEDVFPDLSIFGGWVRLLHEVTKLSGDKVLIPLGYFRIERLVVDPLAGNVTVSGVDSGAFVEDYNLVTLQQGEVAAGTRFDVAADNMLTAAMGGVTPWWGILVNRNAAPLTTVPARLQYDRETRVEAVQSLLRSISREIKVAIDGINVFVFAIPATEATPPVAEIHPGALGNLEEMSTTMDRSGVANVVTVSYTVGQEQRRKVVEYTANALIAAGGPFGRVSIEGQGANIDSDAAADSVAQATLAASTQYVRDIEVACSPVYGIEAGDVVTVQGLDLASTATTRVVGGRIPLTALGGWSLTVRCFQPLMDVGRRVVIMP